jgi:hypothetical protein
MIELLLLLLLLLLFDGGVFEIEALFKFILRLFEQREGSREGRTTDGVGAAIVRVIVQRWTFEFLLRSLAVIVFISEGGGGGGEEEDDSSCGIFAITNVSERWRTCCSSSLLTGCNPTR